MTGTEQTDVHPHQFRLYQNSYLDTTSLRLLLNRVRRTEHYARILLATETKEFSEAGILRLPHDLSLSFRVLHPLAQWTVSTCS